MGRTSRSLSGDESGAKYLRFQEEVEAARLNVVELELVLAIVAPMKAGKSTIINAIVGQDLLPSRAAAMTTLPTKIVLRANEAEPILELKTDILQNTLSKLQQRILEIGVDQAKAEMSNHPHLHELLNKIQTADCSISSKTIGLEAIKQTLTDLNDVVRVCSILAPSSDPLCQPGFTVPQICTPFWKATDNNQSKFLGNLVIVDTPGPNEAGNLRLSAVVDEQLRRSSMVLIVLDFTQLNNQAAAEIKRQIEPVIQLLGKEKLYVLVNKVDQRTATDPMTPEMVQQFVLADLGLGEPRDAERVFEVSARQAFCAARFLSELQHFPDIKKEEMKTARDLAEQAFGIDWEEDFEDASLEDLQRKALRLWKKSGFEPFLTDAINVLMASAAPLCIRSALDLSRSCLEELRNYTQLRGSAIDQDAEKLSTEILALKEDLNCLEVCRRTVKDVDAIKKDLKDVLDNLLRELKTAAQVRLEDYFAKEEYNRSDPAQKLLIDTKRHIPDVIKDAIKNFERLSDWATGKLNSALEAKSSGVVSFEFEKDAEKFTGQMVTHAQKRVEGLLVPVRQEMIQKVEQTRDELTQRLKQETDPIIERARIRLNRSFVIDIYLPSPTIDSTDHVAVTNPHIKNQKKTVDQGYEDVKTMERVWWNWLYLVPVETTRKQKRPGKEVDYYTVSLDELLLEINQSIELSVDRIKEELNRYFDDDFQTRIDHFFKRLDRYLNSYRDSLKQAQKDQQRSLEERSRLVAALKRIDSEATEQIKKCKSLNDRAMSVQGKQG